MKKETSSKFVKKLNADWRTKSALQAISFASKDRFPNRIAITSSFGVESSVLLDLVSKVDRNLPILFIETGKHFADTLSYRDTLIAHLGLKNIVNLSPSENDLSLHDPKGVLYQTDTDKCCNIRKVVPLNRAIEGIDAWISGRKRYQNASREDLPIFELARGGKVKVNPLANWNEKDIKAYMQNHKLPIHPLLAKGFPSVGCEVCTTRVAPGEDPRAGRWRGSEKSECGIHQNAAGEWIKSGS